LRDLLTDECASCGHATLQWSGQTLPDLEAAIANAQQFLATAPGSLASLRASVAPYLAEPVTA